MRFKNQSTVLIQARDEIGLTQTEIAKKLKITTQQYHQFEMGKVGVPAKYVKRIEKILDTELIDAVKYDILDNYSRKAGY